MKEFTITRSEAGQRFDKYIGKVLKEAPMSFVYKMLRKKNITLNGKKADGKEKLTENDVVRFFFADETFDKFSVANTKQSVPKKLTIPKEAKDISVLYENEDVLLLHKPVGILSQKAEQKDYSANEFLLSYLVNEIQSVTGFKPAVCNRLDRNTSGILLCGKTMTGAQVLSQLLKDRTLEKYYRCIVLGKIQSSHLNGYLKKDEANNTVRFETEYFEGSDRVETAWEAVDVFEIEGKLCTELEVHLITGKTHQIRAHLSGLGHPLLGDYKYGNRSFNDKLKKQYGLKSQLLHAYRVEFPRKLDELPECAGLVVTDPLPDLFVKLRRL